MENDVLTTQHQEEFENLIQGMIEHGFGCCDHFLDNKTVTGLRNKLLKSKKEGLMKVAGIGRKFDFQENARIRGDVIKWIEQDSRNIHELLLMKKIDAFIKYLNQTCYAGINDHEFHYAYYEKNTFYKRHLDQFKSNSGRKYSLVMYLNKDWKPTDGGKLTLFLQNGEAREVFPTAGKAVFFKSNEIEHEVSPSMNRYRIGIAGWLKST